MLEEKKEERRDGKPPLLTSFPPKSILGLLLGD